MPAYISTYMNKPVIALKRDAEDNYPFTFGLSKARLILANIDAIRQFVHEQAVKEDENFVFTKARHTPAPVVGVDVPPADKVF